MTKADQPLPGLPLGISTFEALRAQQTVYADKTALVSELAEWPAQKIFLARPRRFGKSLLSSTFRSLFANNLRDFEGLDIARTWKDKTYPVVYLDFSGLPQFHDEEAFRRALSSRLLSAFEGVGFRYDDASRLSFFDQFRVWLAGLPLNSLVLIIDEYDAPLTALLNNEEAFTSARNILFEFYSRLKEGEGALRFLFMTGITKFNKASVFSSLNNLTDISLDPHFGSFLGLTEEELDRYFSPHLNRAAQTLGLSGKSDLIAKMAAMYDGFCFDRFAKTHVFNPWSVLKFLRSPEMGFINYWYDSGAEPTFLMNALSAKSLEAPEAYLRPRYADLSELVLPADYETINPDVLLFQAGYLTIKQSDGESVEMGYPNTEVAKSIANLVIRSVLSAESRMKSGTGLLKRSFEAGDVHAVMESLSRALRMMDYKDNPVGNEAACRAYLQMLLLGATLLTHVEVHNAEGRSDIEVFAGEWHWVFEIKFVEKNAEAAKALDRALMQMESKHYGEDLSGLKLIQLGVVYSAEAKTIACWKRA